MYQDLIRNELNEAAETLANFLKDDAIFTPFSARRSCWLTVLKRVVRYFPAVTAAPIAMRCTLLKS